MGDKTYRFSSGFGTDKIVTCSKCLVAVAIENHRYFGPVCGSCKNKALEEAAETMEVVIPTSTAGMPRQERGKPNTFYYQKCGHAVPAHKRSDCILVGSTFRAEPCKDKACAKTNRKLAIEATRAKKLGKFVPPPVIKHCGVREATHVRVNGKYEKIVSKRGIGPNGRLAPPSEGGFSVVTENGNIVDMWNAYGKYAPAEEHE